MVNDGASNTTRQPAEHGGRRSSSTTNTNATTPPSPSPSPAPRRPRRAIPPPSTVLPPPSTPVAGSSTTASSSSSSSGRKQKSVICPICKKDMCHEKALCGHIRWHTQAERQAAYTDIAKALSSNFISSEHQPSPKRFKLPDLNQPPPPDDDA